MSKENTNNKYGFTIIEVVLVLAIAGLIFLMVFVALPALQRSQRDTQRRNDMSRVDTSLVQYQTNHSNLPLNLPDIRDGGIEASEQVQSWIANTDNTFGQYGCGTNVPCAFIRDYMNTGSNDNDSKENNFEDPDGTPYSIAITRNWAIDPPSGTMTVQNESNDSELDGDTTNGYALQDGQSGHAYDAHVIWIIPGGSCKGDKAVPSTKRHFAILYRLEGAGSYCIDDQ